MPGDSEHSLCDALEGNHPAKVNHFLPGGPPLPLQYHQNPIPMGFDDFRIRRVTELMHAAIDCESFVVDQPRQFLEWHSYLHMDTVHWGEKLPPKYLALCKVGTE